MGNLDAFKRTTSFQSGILSLMANLSSGVEDLEMLKTMFNKLDADKNGTLTIHEIRKGFDEVSQLGNSYKKRSAAEYKEMMMSLDTNGDGVISFDEFIAAAANKVALLNKDNINAAFSLIDTDGSGSITIEELRSAFDTDHNQQKDMSLWQNIMREVDKDGDNKISKEEFFEAMTAVLKQHHAADARV